MTAISNPTPFKELSIWSLKPDILAVIGHYTSDMTVSTVDIYNRNKLIAISPGSTTEELTRKPRKFFFRTAPTTSIEAEALVNQLLLVGRKKSRSILQSQQSIQRFFVGRIQKAI